MSDNLTYNKDMPRVVYHYCKTENFLSIIQDNKFRLCNISKSNDTMEIEYAIPLIRNKICTIFNKEYFGEDRQQLLSIIDNLFEYKINQFTKNVYVVCFSECADSVTQWDMYANRGKGFAIGINCGMLNNFASNLREVGLRFGKVKYINELGKESVKIIRSAVQKIQEEDCLNTQVENILNAMVSALLKDIAFIKSKSYEHEKEWRLVLDPKADIGRFRDLLVYVSRICNMDRFGFESLEIGGIKFEPIQDGKNISSYFILDFYKSSRDFVKEIVLGPCLNIDVNDTDLNTLIMLRELLPPRTSKKLSFKIKKSQVSYNS